MTCRWIGYTGVLLFVTGLLAASELQADDVSVGLTPYDAYQAEADEVRRTFLIETYRRSSPASRQWDADAIEVLDMLFQWQTSQPDRPTLRELRRAADALYGASVRDPLILYAQGYARDRENGDRLARAYFESADKLFQESRYPPILRAPILLRMANHRVRWKREAEAEPLFEAGVDELVEAIRSDTLGESVRSFTTRISGRFGGTLPFQYVDLLLEALRDDPGAAEPWLMYMLEAEAAYHKAWEERGTGFAPTVTDQAWDRFREHLQAALQWCQKAYETQPDRPEAATLAIQIAQSGVSAPGEDEMFWFERARAAQYDWLPAYDAVLWSLRPRWGGSHEAMWAFAEACANDQRYDTDVPLMVVEALEVIGMDGRAAMNFCLQPAVHQRVTEVIEATVAARSRDVDLNRLHSQGAALAWHNGRMDDLVRHVAALPGELDDAACASLFVHDEDIRRFAAMYASGAADLIKQADDAVGEESPADVAEMYRRAADQLLPGQARHQAMELATMTAWFGPYAAGELVELQFLEGLPGWRVRRGHWQRQDDGRVRGGPDEDGLLLVCLMPLGPRWELQCNVDINRLSRAPNAGVVFNLSDWFDLTAYHAVQVLPGPAARVNMNHLRGTGETVDIRREVPDRRTIHIRVWDDSAVVLVDGEFIHRGPLPTRPGYEFGSQIGLGGYYKAKAGFAEFQDVYVRRLFEKPQELLVEVEE